MVNKLYSEFDSDVVIRSAIGKTFNVNQIDFKFLNTIEGVNQVSKVIEEVVVLKNEKKWVNAQMIGVDSSFLNMSHMENHIIDGFPTLNENNKEVGLIGATLLDNLGGYISESENESLIIYAPKRNAKVKFGSNPFNTSFIQLSGRINFNKEVNAEILVVPINYAREILDYDTDITSIYVDVKEGHENDFVKNEIISHLGKEFIVKTNYEKNELIFKTSKTEKLIVMIILLFIFIVAF